jgi:hypothetical protein
MTWRNVADVITEAERKRVADLHLDPIFGQPEPRIPTLDEQRAAEKLADDARRAQDREQKRRHRQRMREGSVT